MSDTYSSHATHGHSTSPNLPLSDVKWEHNLHHNPYASHSIYSASNIMPISQTMTPPNSLPSAAAHTQPSSSPVMSQGLNQSEMGNYKEENGSQQQSSSPAGQHSSAYGVNLPPTPASMVTMLGPNSGELEFGIFKDVSSIPRCCSSGNSNSNEAATSETNNLQHLTSQWVMSPSQIRNSSPNNNNQVVTSSLGQLGQSLATFGQNTIQHHTGIHGYASHGAATKTFGHQPFYGWY